MKRSFTRKEFLTTSGKAGCSLLAAAGGLSMLESCGSVKVYKTASTQGRIAVPVTEFVENNIRIVRVSELSYDIALFKKSPDQYNALLMRCTHQDWNLSASSKNLN